MQNETKILQKKFCLFTLSLFIFCFSIVDNFAIAISSMVLSSEALEILIRATSAFYWLVVVSQVKNK